MSLSTPEERAAFGRQARAKVPRSRHGEWKAPADRTDPLEILALQATTRVPDLVPIRYGRMAASPFAFFRGAAAVMASDLACEEHSHLDAQLCGDAHLMNFGGFASPERDMVFDVNDFDETLPGPFEWDLKRLAASIEVAARSREFDDDLRTSLVTQSACAYRQAIREFGGMTNLDVWYQKLDNEVLMTKWGEQASREVLRNMQKMVTKAQSKDHLSALAKLTEVVDGKLQFISNPPLMSRADEVFDDVHSDEVVAGLMHALSEYRQTLALDRQLLLERYEFVDLARKVVGVGSVGTRCWVALFIGRDRQDPLILQIKQAEEAVGAAFLAKSRFDQQGQRVVEGQRLMQSSSDIFLGWDCLVSPDGVTRDFYVRQLWDWKLSATVETMLPEGMGFYAQMCGWTLARAHARSGDSIAIGSYLGAGDRFDRSMAQFASSYADQNEKDFAALKQAIASNQIHAISDV
jgi:uncharacterized protein (DUF2252 family)